MGVRMKNILSLLVLSVWALGCGARNLDKRPAPLASSANHHAGTLTLEWVEASGLRTSVQRSLVASASGLRTETPIVVSAHVPNRIEFSLQLEGDTKTRNLTKVDLRHPYRGGLEFHPQVEFEYDSEVRSGSGTLTEFETLNSVHAPEAEPAPGALTLWLSDGKDGTLPIESELKRAPPALESVSVSRQAFFQSPTDYAKAFHQAFLGKAATLQIEGQTLHLLWAVELTNASAEALRVDTGNLVSARLRQQTTRREFVPMVCNTGIKETTEILDESLELVALAISATAPPQAVGTAIEVPAHGKNTVGIYARGSAGGIAAEKNGAAERFSSGQVTNGCHATCQTPRPTQGGGLYMHMQSPDYWGGQGFPGASRTCIDLYERRIVPEDPAYESSIIACAVWERSLDPAVIADSYGFCPISGSVNGGWAFQQNMRTEQWGTQTSPLTVTLAQGAWSLNVGYPFQNDGLSEVHASVPILDAQNVLVP